MQVRRTLAVITETAKNSLNAALVGMKSAWRGIVWLARRPLDKHYTRTAEILQGVFVLGCLIYFKLWSPAPVGVAIALLGLAAAIMAFRTEKSSKWAEKATWGLIVVSLCVVEIRAIYRERNEHEVEQQRIRKKESDQFERVLKQNQKNFGETLEKMNGLATSGRKAIDLSTEAIGEITGGDTYIYLVPARVPQPLSSFVIFAHGRHPFFAESKTVYDSSAFHDRTSTFGVIASTSLGTIYPRWATPP